MAKKTFDVLNLPLSEISPRIEDWSLTIFSPAGYGKTTLIHNAFGSKVVFARGENGTKAIRTRGFDINGDFNNVLKFLYDCQTAVKEGNSLPFNAICFDTMDAVADSIVSYVTDQDGEEVFTKEKNNSGYATCRRLFADTVSQFEALGLYCIYLVHYAEKTVKRKLTDSYDEGQMSVSGTFQKICFDGVDLCGVILQEKDENENIVRRLYFRHPDFGVKTRLSCMPDYINLGNSAEEAGRNFLSAFQKAVHDESLLSYNQVDEKSKSKKSEKTEKVSDPVKQEVIKTDSDGVVVDDVPPFDPDDESKEEPKVSEVDLKDMQKKVADYFKRQKSEGKITRDDIPVLMNKAFGVATTKEIDDVFAIYEFLANKMTEDTDEV